MSHNPIVQGEEGGQYSVTPNEYSISFVCAQSLSHVQLFVTPRTVAHQAPLSMGFSRQEFGVRCHFLLQGIFPTQRKINP